VKIEQLDDSWWSVDRGDEWKANDNSVAFQSVVPSTVKLLSLPEAA